MVLGMETKSFVWVVWIQVWNLSKMYGYMFGGMDSSMEFV